MAGLISARIILSPSIFVFFFFHSTPQTREKNSSGFDEEQMVCRRSDRRPRPYTRTRCRSNFDLWATLWWTRQSLWKAAINIAIRFLKVLGFPGVIDASSNRLECWHFCFLNEQVNNKNKIEDVGTFHAQHIQQVEQLKQMIWFTCRQPVSRAFCNWNGISGTSLRVRVTWLASFLSNSHNCTLCFFSTCFFISFERVGNGFQRSFTFLPFWSNFPLQAVNAWNSRCCWVVC